MRKFFTFAIALMACVSLTRADETIFLWQHDASGSTVYGDGNNGVFEMQGDSIGTIMFVTYEGKKTGNDGTIGYVDGVADTDLKPNIAKALKLGNNGAHLRITPKEGKFQAGDIIYICGFKNVIVSVSDDPTSTSKIAGTSATILNGDLALGTEKGKCDVGEYELPASFTDNAEIYISRANGNSCGIAAIKVVRPANDGKPVLSVNPEVVTFELTAANPSAEATVKFGGKNLAKGEYALTVPNLDGLTITPTAVSVGDDGKLSAEVKIAYASAVDVAAASTEIGLTIGELTQKVKINYSAAMAKEYGKSVNIEQWVLDNGKNDNAFKAVLEAANIDYANIDQLDSLNDSKDNRNYPFLGLKLKKADATIGCWVKAGSTIKVRFGNVGADFKVSLNGVEETMTNALANATVTDKNELSYTATADTYALIKCNSTKTLVIKQIMINEEIKDVVLPGSPQAIDNTDAEVKAQKVVRNGQLFIEKNGVLYNAQGTVVR